MMGYKSTAYFEGDSLGGGWRYRINRVVKTNDALAYTVVLTHDDPSKRARKLYLWLSEFATVEDARAAAHKVLGEWAEAPHFGLGLLYV